MLQTYTISQNRYIDSNNFLYIKNQCVMRAGIFEYMAHEIRGMLKDDSIKDNEIIRVYRPADSLEKIKDAFANKPITLEHSWVSVLENNNIVGNIGTNITFDKDKGEIIADLITIYNADAIKDIMNNLRDKLSAGFKHDLIKQEGEYDGVKYSYIQVVTEVNHLALCENPRDSNLQIHDSKSNFNLTKGVKKMSFKLIDLINRFNDKGKKVQDSVTDDDLEALKGEDTEAEIATDNDANCETKTQDSEEESKATDNDAETQAQDSEGDDKFAEILKAIEAINERLNALENKKEALQDSEGETQDSEEESKAQDDDTTLTKEDVDKEVKEKVAEALAERDKEEAEFTEAYDSVSKAIGAFMPFNANNKRKKASEIYAYGVKILGERNGLNFGKVQDSKSAFIVANQIIESQNNKAQDSKPHFISDIKDTYVIPGARAR